MINSKNDSSSTFTLADLLTLIGTLVFGLFCYLSFNFLSMGETVSSVSRASGIALLLGGLAFGAKVFKTRSRNFKTFLIWEWIFLLLFASVAVFAVIPFSHYFTVLDKKEEIQDKVIANITQAEGIFPAYESYADSREKLYKKDLQSAVADKNENGIGGIAYRKYGFIDGTSDNVQIENKKFTLHAKLFPSNYAGQGGIKQVATDWFAYAKHVLENEWAFTFGLVHVIKNVQTNITTWKGELIRLSSFRATGESAEDFPYTITFTDATDMITKPSSPTPLAIGIAVVLYVMMLFSYFVSNRHTRYPGLKMIFGTRAMKENEL